MDENKEYLSGADEEETLPAPAEYEEDAPEEVEVEEEDKPVTGTSPTFIRGLNRFQLMGAICGYACALILMGLLGMAGLFDAQSTTMPSLLGMAAGYGVGTWLTKRAEAREAAEKADEKTE